MATIAIACAAATLPVQRSAASGLLGDICLLGHREREDGWQQSNVRHQGHPPKNKVSCPDGREAKLWAAARPYEGQPGD